jgi:hypothetical protein
MRSLFVIAALACVLQAGAATPDACHLLTKSDAPFEETKLTTTTDGALAVSQCFYRLPQFDQSISLTVLRGSAADVRTYWRTHLEKHGGEEGEGGELRKVRGVGDEAVWTGNRIAGALYVLRGRAIVRVSVGGGGTVEEKIAKARKLARAALRRM